MPEATAQSGQTNRLEQKRFIVKPESLGIMKRVRDSIPTLQKDYPYLRGVGFYGSRTTGMENRDGKISDMDMCLFFDDTDYQGIPVYNDLMSTKDEIMKITGVKTEPFLINISRANTDSNIDMFSRLANHALTHGQSYLDLSLPVSDLVYQFYFAVGDDVYKSRAYILNKLKTLPRGEEYFQVLMNTLTRRERFCSTRKYPMPNYDRMPKTIAEAEKYFFTEPDSEESLVAA